MPDLKDFPDVTQMAIPFFVVAILIEVFVIRYLKGRGDYETRDTTTSLLMGVGNVASGLLLGFIAFGVLMWAWQFRIVDLGSSWWVIALCFVLDDLRYYWYHRIAHRCRWVWAEHVIHHSSQHYNLSTALRQSWTGTFTGMFILRIPLALIGFHPVLLLFVGGLNLVYQFWIHTETIGRMWRPIEWIFNTPSHHRVHHATNPRYLDSNYAGTLIIWDRMFGTFVPELDEDMPRYGIVKNIGTFNPVRVAFHEWIDMFRDAMRPGLSIRQRLSYLFAPPGWSHDGSRKGSELLKADYVALNPETAGTPGLPPGLHGAARGSPQTAQTGVAAAE
jgi:sterol desaturase/sphingolipid hydroxylase (fatty acid hydroxylase superfamily)